MGPGPKIIAHVCNDGGGWGRGFVVALSARWREPEAAFRAWARGKRETDRAFELGAVQLVGVEDGLWVANLVGQRGTRAKGGLPPVRYEAIATGLATIAGHARRLGASVHMPRIGCGLAGGTWERIGPLVESELAAKGVVTVVYDFD